MKDGSGVIKVGMNKQSGNMYSFVTHTWNPIRGKCPHECKYCYMNRIWNLTKSERQLLDKESLNDNLGEGNVIFVGSSTDMWADSTSDYWIDQVLRKCMANPKNIYLFQTKNPKRFHEFLDYLPKKNTILGTTLESNRDYNLSKSPCPMNRQSYMSSQELNKFKKMISIEPVLDFDLHEFPSWIRDIEPTFVSIGGDSKNHNLPEPSPKKVNKLIKELEKFTEVRIKPNLKRICKVIKNG